MLSVQQILQSDWSKVGRYSKSRRLLVNLSYVSLVKPHLGYGSQVWDPYLSKDKMTIVTVPKIHLLDNIEVQTNSTSHKYLLHILRTQRLVHINYAAT